MPDPEIKELETKEPKVYKNEGEKTAALNAIQNKEGGATVEDLGEIDLITQADILESPPPSPTEDVVEPEKKVEPAKPADETKPSEEKPTPKDETARDFHITEDLISKYDETYYDPESKRNRAFITQKTGDDLLKSYIGAQKNNYYLKNQRLPQEHQAGYDKAKAEAEEQLAAIRKELEELKVKPPVEPKPAQEPTITDSSKDLNDLLVEIKGIPEGDTVEHTDKMRNALILSQKVMLEKDKRYADNIDKARTDDETRFSQFKEGFKKEQEEKAKDDKLRDDIAEHKQKMEVVYSEIDAFAGSKEAPVDVKTDQKYKEMLAEATNFHNQLAELYTGKTRRDYDDQTWNTYMENAGTAYLNDLPELVNAMKQNGITAPRNYKQWVKLDAYDAIRTGWWRDPVSNKWEKRYATNTGQQIHLGDMVTAYNYYLDQSGLRKQKIEDEKKKNTDGLLESINKRDMTQLDESQLSQEGEGQALTEEDADKIIVNADMDNIIAQYQMGNPEPLNRINKAYIRKNQTPLEPKDFVR